MTGTQAKDVRLYLLGGFELRVDGRSIPIMMAPQRVVAFLALRDRSLARTYVSGTLWPDTAMVRANANLRSALWRLQRSCPIVIDASMQHLRLVPEVEVDLRSAVDIAHGLLEPAVSPANGELDASARLQLSGDLLPDWDDDWLLMERERFHQLRLHALELLCERLSNSGRYAAAVDAGLAAVRGEPLRETAQMGLIRAYVAEGNHTEAVRQYVRYEQMLKDDLGIEPSAELRAVVDRGRVGPHGRDGRGSSDGLLRQRVAEYRW